MSSGLMLTASYLLTSLVTTTQASVSVIPDAQYTKKVQCSSLIASHAVVQGPTQTNLQKYGGSPYGPDPHGGDPHDEQHDSDLPANKDRDYNKAPDDVYGGKYPNGRAPY